MINEKKHILKQTISFCLLKRIYVTLNSLSNILITDIDEALACMAIVFVQFYFELSGISARDMQGHR